MKKYRNKATGETILAEQHTGKRAIGHGALIVEPGFWLVFDAPGKPQDTAYSNDHFAENYVEDKPEAKAAPVPKAETAAN
ncbi:MAG: hypothetical protein JSS75_07170 [Bacteroidetes bacterium]|nr:hypothetical protein [Bacteroidota bacterium]